MSRLLPFLLLVALSAGCDSKPASDAKSDAKTDAKADAKADAKTPDAKAPDAKAPDAKAGLPAAEYPKAIVGKWKQVKMMIAIPGGEPMDVTPPDAQMFLEFTADGKFINSGTVSGKEHKTETTYELEGSTFRVGDNAPISIVSLSADRLTTETKTDSGASVTEYERAK